MLNTIKIMAKKIKKSLYFAINLMLLTIICFYQKIISPLLPKRCRFYPTCSQYCAEVIKKYGPIVGVIKGIKRILKCHPWHDGGFDPS